MYSILESKNRLLKDEAIQFAQRLVKLPSVSGEEGVVAECVAQEMRTAGFQEVVQDEVGNAIGIIRGREGSPTLLLNAHMDTAEPVDDETTNVQEPGSIEDGRLFGPGASDCKSGIAACVYAAKLLRRSLLPLRGNLIFAATTAEEMGDSVGVRHLMKETLPRLGLQPDYAVLAEPTDLGIYCGHDGWMQVQVCVEGDDPDLVKDTAYYIYHDLSKRANQDYGLTGYGCFEVHRPELITENGSGNEAIVRVDERMPTAVHPERFLESLRKRVNLIASDVQNVRVGVSIARESLPLFTGRVTPVHRIINAWSTDPNSPLINDARRSLDAAGQPAPIDRWQLGRFGTGTAGGVLVNECQVPTMGYGPGDEHVIHAPGEYVTVERIPQAVYGLASITHSLIGVPVFGWTSDEI
jgi:acetylornithine deacetylase/succinyl-diaminopimelate desuccinylase-like protein